MELIEVSDQSFLPVSTAVGGQNLILHGFSPAHFLNDGGGGFGGGGGAFELIEEFPTAGVGLDGQASFLQVVEPSPTVLVNYVIGANGSLIPVYDRLPIDNTVTFVTGAPEPALEPSVPAHILDHMYARKPKEPGTETPTKPRKRAKKKEPPPPPIVHELIMPDIMSPNTTKVNIIRKGLAVSTPQPTFRTLNTSRPKILQNIKTITTPPQRAGSSSAIISDLNKYPSPNRTSASSPSPSPIITISPPRRIDLNGAQTKDIPISSPTKQFPSIYFLPPKASPSDVSEIIGSPVGDVPSRKASFVVTTKEATETDGKQTEQMCFVLPSSSSFSSSLNSSSKTDQSSQPQQQFDHTSSGQVTTFQLNSDGTLSAVPSADESVITYTTAKSNQQQQQDHHPETYREFSLCSFSDDVVGSAAESEQGNTGGEGENTTGGSFQLGDKQIFFSYE